MAEQDGPRSEAERAEQPEESTGGAHGAMGPGGTQPNASVPETGPAEPPTQEPPAGEPAAMDPVREPVATDATGETAAEPAPQDASRSGADAGAKTAPQVDAAAAAADHPDEPDAPAPQQPAAQQPSPAPGDPAFDEEAAWAAIVAGYGEEPPDPPGARPFKPIEDLPLPEPDPGQGQGTSGGTTRRPRVDERGEKDCAETGKGGSSGKSDKNSDAKDSHVGDGDERSRPAGSLGGSVSFAPGVGPRDYRPAAPADDDVDADDEGHFVPPEPPPLPSGDTTARFGWLAVLGGPLLLLLSVLLGWQMTWWLATLGIGGFVGGFVTLVVRMNPGDGDDDDPGRGAVV